MDNIQLIIQSQQGNKEARDRLVQENMGLVWSVVRRFHKRGYESEDLFQIGCIGLLKAIDKFDVSLELKFSTYAVPMILGELKRFMRDDGMIKVSRSIKENSWKVKKAIEQMSKESGKEPTMEELEEVTKLDREDIVVALEACSEVDSIYKKIHQGDGSEIALVDKYTQIQDDKEELLNHMLLEQLIAGLNEKEQQLIRLRYYQEKTQTEVAGVLGISQVQVSRLEKKILLEMRKYV